MGSIHTINRLNTGLVQESLIQSHATRTLSQASPPDAPVDYLCGELWNGDCESYSNRLKVVKEGLFSQESDKRKLALHTLKNLIWDSPDRIYKEEPELIREACRMAREDPDKKVQIIAYGALSMYFYHRHLSGLLLETELSKEGSLINKIVEVFLQTLQDPDLEMRRLAHEDEVLEFLRIHPQFINKVYDIMRDQIIHAKTSRDFHTDFGAFANFNGIFIVREDNWRTKQDEYTWSSEQIDQMLLEAYKLNPDEDVKAEAIHEVTSVETLFEILKTHPEGEVLARAYGKLNYLLSNMPREAALDLLDTIIYGSFSEDSIIAALELKVERLKEVDNDNNKAAVKELDKVIDSFSSEDVIIAALKLKKTLLIRGEGNFFYKTGASRDVYMQAVNHPYKKVRDWGSEEIMRDPFDFKPSQLKAAAKNYFDLDSIYPIQLAVPKRVGHEVISNPEDLGKNPELLTMAYGVYQTIREPSYKIFFEEVNRLNNNKARPFVLNYERFTYKRKKANDPEKKHDAVGLSGKRKESIFKGTMYGLFGLDYSPLAKITIHELGHFLMRICYPVMPGILGYNHDEEHDHSFDQEVSLADAWVEGVANAFEFVEKIRTTGTLSFDELENEEHLFSNYSLYYKRRNEYFIGAVLATYLIGANNELDPIRFKAFVDTLSNGGKCNRTHFGVRQFVVDFAREHPEEREAFYGALDKYGMMGLVPKRFLDA